MGTFSLQYLLLLFLRRRQHFQYIYELSPETHQAKRKTPSFGGVGIVLSLFLGCLYFSCFDMASLWLLSLVTVFSVIGFLDDYLSLAKKENKGLTARLKFVLQCFAAAFFVLVFSLLIKPVSLGMGVVAIFVIVGASNACNLTDGLDGLLTGLTCLSLFGFFLVFNTDQASHLEFVLMCFLVLLVFLFFNRFPAKMFMGDTGSLALGAMLAGLGLLSDSIWHVLVFGAVFVLETLSVMVQVAWFKLRRKRVFLMAPLHHHFEMMGMLEKNVVWLFWGLGGCFVFLGWVLYVL